MTKVQIQETSAAAAPKPGVAAADEVVDSLGRRLKIRRPDILQESRLVRVMGDASTNAAYMTGYVMPAVMVSSIDDEDLPFPATEREVEAAIKRLGREGMSAVMQFIVAEAQQNSEEAAAAKN